MGAVGNVTVCRTCGVESASPLPEVCPICDDDRQWVPASGQRWVTRRDLEESGHRLTLAEVEHNLYSLRTTPKVGIGQTCYLARTPAGNLLFDVPGYFDAEAVSAIDRLGGVAAIVPSHPHMYGIQSLVSAAFGNAPIWICSADSDWIQRPTDAIRFFDSEVEPLPGTTVRRVGGHFPGSTVAVWPGADGRGVLLGGDSISPVARPGWVTFMRSFPNYLPLSAGVVRRIAAAVADLRFDRIHGNFGQTCAAEGKAAVAASAERYAEWVSGLHDDLT